MAGVAGELDDHDGRRLVSGRRESAGRPPQGAGMGYRGLDGFCQAWEISSVPDGTMEGGVPVDQGIVHPGAVVGGGPGIPRRWVRRGSGGRGSCCYRCPAGARSALPAGICDAGRRQCGGWWRWWGTSPAWPAGRPGCVDWSTGGFGLPGRRRSARTPGSVEGRSGVGRGGGGEEGEDGLEAERLLFGPGRVQVVDAVQTSGGHASSPTPLPRSPTRP